MWPPKASIIKKSTLHGSTKCGPPKAQSSKFTPAWVNKMWLLWAPVINSQAHMSQQNLASKTANHQNSAKHGLTKSGRSGPHTSKFNPTHFKIQPNMGLHYVALQGPNHQNSTQHGLTKCGTPKLQSSRNQPYMDKQNVAPQKPNHQNSPQHGLTKCGYFLPQS